MLQGRKNHLRGAALAAPAKANLIIYNGALMVPFDFKSLNIVTEHKHAVRVIQI
jgi:hypothetical protein